MLLKQTEEKEVVKEPEPKKYVVDNTPFDRRSNDKEYIARNIYKLNIGDNFWYYGQEWIVKDIPNLNYPDVYLPFSELERNLFILNAASPEFDMICDFEKMIDSVSRRYR